jgi:hypothetical protein
VCDTNPASKIRPDQNQKTWYLSLVRQNINFSDLTHVPMSWSQKLLYLSHLLRVFDDVGLVVTAIARPIY